MVRWARAFFVVWYFWRKKFVIRITYGHGAGMLICTGTDGTFFEF